MITETDKPISVVVPSKDGRRTLRRALDSVALSKQFVREVIVVFSNSPAEYKQFCEAEFGDFASHFELIFLDSGAESNGSIARNMGIQHARGKYVALLDDDDQWFDGKCKAFMDYIRGCEAAESLVLFSQVVSCNEDLTDSIIFPGVRYRGGPIADFILSPLGGAQTSSLMLSTLLARRVGFDPRLKRHQDYDFCMRLEAAGARFHEIATPLSYWYQSGRSVDKGATMDFCKQWLLQNRSRVSRIAFIGYIEKELFRSARQSNRVRDYFQFAWTHMTAPEFIASVFRLLLRVSKAAFKKGRRFQNG